MHFLLKIIIQIAVILISARLVGLLFRKIHQPQVVGEMVAGILLGPSLLGWVAPGISAYLFPPDSLQYLNILSQIGLLLFMFIIGLELDIRLLRGRGQAALVVSHVSIVLPFLLGALLALYLYPRLSDETVTFTGFTLFMGAAMSITAFPVLARILTERNLIHTKVGAITIACAAVNDVTAWCILALVIAIVRAGAVKTPLWLTIAGSITYIFLMVFLARQALARLEAYYRSRGRFTQDMIGLILLLLLASAWATEWLGIHALFGAFIIGAVMPKSPDFVHDLTEKLEDVTVVLLLPLFFAFTGLHTSIGLVSGTEMWLFFGIITLAAVGGKFGGSTIAARLTGLSWREAGALGILMNTRGLMELVILSIGLEFGVISPVLYTMMVMMALATTFMTTPILEWIYPLRFIQKETAAAEKEPEEFTVLIPVSLPSSGPGLLRVAAALAAVHPPRIYALHLLRAGERSMKDFPGMMFTTPTEAALKPILEAAENLDIPVQPLSFVSQNTAKDIYEMGQVKGANLIIMGWHKPVLSQSILSGTIHDVMREARADVCVFLQRQFQPWKRILVPYREGMHDRGALQFARQIGIYDDGEITILHVVEPRRENQSAEKAQLRGYLEEEHFISERVRLQVVESDKPLDVAVQVSRQGYDLVIVGVSEAWGLEPSLFSGRHERLARECPASLLIVRKFLQKPSLQSESAAKLSSSR